MADPGESYYEILNVRRDASPQEITAAYRRLAKILHPDVCSDPAADELFKSINEAYQVLRDQKKREEYDLSLLAASGSDFGEYYTGKTRYRDPRTWYYAHMNQSYHHPGGSPTGSGMQQGTRSQLPRLLQVLLFYLTLLMAIVILAQLFLLPWMAGTTASEARIAFEDGNRWMNEEEFQKAIESYGTAVRKLPGLMEGWRAKGLAELKKGDELKEKGFSTQAEGYYHEAAESLLHAYNAFPGDSQVLYGLGKALLETGNRDDGVVYLRRAHDLDPGNREIQSALNEAFLRRT